MNTVRLGVVVFGVAAIVGLLVRHPPKANLAAAIDASRQAADLVSARITSQVLGR